ncbi:MAG: radical SAM/SPASM domain-containing protein [Methanosarcinaceae archaeon]
MPIELNLEISTQCNLSCLMCPKRVYTQNNHSQLDLGGIGKAIERLGVKVVRFSGLGEPMLAPEFWNIAEAVSRNGCKLAMVTNGTLLNDDAVRKLCSISSMLTVSLDAATPETYQYIRGRDAFEDLYCTICDIYKNKVVSRKGLPILAINWVLMKRNYQELPVLVKRLSKDGIKVDLIHCDPLVPYTPEMEKEVLSANYTLLGFLDGVRKQALKAGIYLEYPYYTRNGQSSKMVNAQKLSVSCHAIWESLFIDHQEEFYPCCEYFHNPIGKISKIDPRNAWNSPEMRMARKRSLKGLPPFAYCIGCHKYRGHGDPSKMLKRVIRSSNEVC